MDSDQGKLFIGGISWETTEEKMTEHFSNYGEVLQTTIMKDKITGRPRGFGFVVFADPALLDTVLQDKHMIDGRTVEAKRAMSREEQQVSKADNPSAGRNFGSSGNDRTKKIFVGGLPPTLSEDEFRHYFESYGQVTDVVVMYDQQTNRPRGFGFISFDSEDAVDRVLHKNYHDLGGKQVEVKRALPKDGSGGGRSMGGGGGGYQGYGSSGGNSSAYESRDSSRYMQSQNSSNGFPSYGSSGYGASGYWGMGSAGYGSYGGANPGYGGMAGAAYGNPGVPNVGYGSGPPGAPRNAYGSQATSGYGNMGYGNAPWGGSSGGTPGSAPPGQSPSGAAGYGNQAYGNGGYGGTDGSYGNPAAYGAVGGRLGSVPNSNASAGGEIQPSGGGYMGGNYGDANGNPGYGSGIYGAQVNGPNGGQVGYGGAPTRQMQQQ